MEQFQRGPFTFDVRDAGPPAGEPVVLLHGFPQDATCWDGVAPLLHDAGLRTLAPDQRGYSPGARPTERRAYAITELVEDIDALLNAAGLETAHVVGHDWGGGVAWGVASLRPERVRSLTVLSTPHGAAMQEASQKSTQLLKSWYMFAMQLPVLPEWFIGNRRLADGLQRAGLPERNAVHNAARMREPGAARGAVNWYRGMPWTLRTPMGRCSVPTTYVWGSGDRYLGRYAAEATEKYVTGPYRFVELDGNHWLPETQPSEVAAAIIAQVQATAAASAAAE